MAPIAITYPLRAFLREGAALALSVSGGKDSQAMVNAVLAEREAEAARGTPWTGPVFMVHADLGRAEWHQTPAFVEAEAERHGLDLVVCQRTNGDMLDRFRDRMEKLDGTGKPFWASSANRYCTSDMKRGPIDTVLRRYDNVVNVMGLRAAESTARSKKPAVALRKQITGKAFRDSVAGVEGPSDAASIAVALRDQRDGRLAIDWNPILHWSTEDVWEACGTSTWDVERRQALAEMGRDDLAVDGFTAHPAYALGNTRLSCSLCVLGCRSDLVNGARRNPEYFHALLELERESGFTFKANESLEEIGLEAGLIDGPMIELPVI